MRESVLSLLVLLVSGAVAEAQSPVKPNMFRSLTTCNAALASRQIRFYEPRYFGLKARNPANSTDRVVVPLETDMCLEMLVVGGRLFVAQREGTLFRAQKLADGSLALYARDDCGNPVYNVVLSPPVLIVREPEPEIPEPQPPQVLRHYEPPLPPPFPGPAVAEKKGGFCRSKKCRFTVLVFGSAAGYAAWRVWPCPPGTVRK